MSILDREVILFIYLFLPKHIYEALYKTCTASEGLKLVLVCCIQKRHMQHHAIILGVFHSPIVTFDGEGIYFFHNFNQLF